jgi:hypothetical protein
MTGNDRGAGTSLIRLECNILSKSHRADANEPESSQFSYAVAARTAAVLNPGGLRDMDCQQAQFLSLTREISQRSPTRQTSALLVSLEA